MKKKLIVAFMIFILLSLSVVFANSYMQGLSKEEILEQKVRNNEIIEEEANEIYRNIEERMINCNNNCKQNGNCQIHKQNSTCRRQNNECLQRNCDTQQNCMKRTCIR